MSLSKINDYSIQNDFSIKSNINSFYNIGKTMKTFGKISNMSKDYLLSSKYTLIVRNYEVEQTDEFNGKKIIFKFF